MAEKVAKVGVRKQAGYLYFVDKNGKRQRVIIKQAHLEAGQLIIDRVLPEGKKEMSWEEFSDR